MSAEWHVVHAKILCKLLHISAKRVVNSPLKEAQTTTFLKFETLKLPELHVVHVKISGKLLHISAKRVVNSPLKETQTTTFLKILRSMSEA